MDCWDVVDSRVRRIGKLGFCLFAVVLRLCIVQDAFRCFRRPRTSTYSSVELLAWVLLEEDLDPSPMELLPLETMEHVGTGSRALEPS